MHSQHFLDSFLDYLEATLLISGASYKWMIGFKLASAALRAIIGIIS